MEIAAFVVSLVALAVGGLGTWLSNKRANEALREARESKTQAMWSDAIAAANRVMVDPTTHSLTEPMQDLRIAITTLGDGYPGTGLDKWLATEHVLGSHMAQIVMEGGPPVHVTPDQQFQRIKPFLDWGSALSRNLRHLRNIGCTPEGIREVHGYAWSALTSQYERFGKGAPPQEFAPIGT